MKRFLSIVTIIGMIGGASTFGCLADDSDAQNKEFTNNSESMNQETAPPQDSQNPQNENNEILPPNTPDESANMGLNAPVSGENCVSEKVDYVVVGVIAAVVAVVTAVIGYFCFKSDSKSSK